MIVHQELEPVTISRLNAPATRYEPYQPDVTQPGSPQVLVDTRNGLASKWLSGDNQQRYDPATGLIDSLATRNANYREAAFDFMGLVPVLGPVANTLRGVYNVGMGQITGNPERANQGVGQVVKGMVYSIPIFGQLAAGIGLAKNLIDAGGAEFDRRMTNHFVQDSMRVNTGYGLGRQNLGPWQF